MTIGENGRKLFKQVENTVGRGEIALYEQFLLFQQCFQKMCPADFKNQGLYVKGLNKPTLNPYIHQCCSGRVGGQTCSSC